MFSPFFLWICVCVCGGVKCVHLCVLHLYICVRAYVCLCGGQNSTLDVLYCPGDLLIFIPIELGLQVHTPNFYMGSRDKLSFSCLHSKFFTLPTALVCPGSYHQSHHCLFSIG